VAGRPRGFNRSAAEADQRGKAEKAEKAGHIGDRREAEPLVQEAFALLEPTDELNARAKAYLALAEVRRCEGRTDAEASALADARALLTAKGNEALLQRITL